LNSVAKVRDVMTADPIRIDHRVSLQEATRIMIEKRIDGLPVVDGQGRLVGIFTKTHAFRALGMDIKTPVGRVMQKKVITISEDATTEEAWKIKVGRLPVVNGQGDLVGMVTRTDLVMGFRRQLQHALEQLGAVLNSAHNSIVAIDRAGKIIIINRAAERLFGLAEKDVLGKHIKDILPNSNLTKVVMSGTAEYGKNLSIGGKAFLANKTPIMHNGVAIGAVDVLQDISELEGISQELGTVKMINRELNTIIDSSVDGIVVSDKDGVIIKANDAYRHIIGIKEDNLVGLPVKWLMDQGYLRESVTLKVLESKKNETISLQVPSGREVILTASPILDDGGDVYQIVANIRDLTELNNLSEQLSVSNALNVKYKSELERYRQGELLADMVFQSEEMVTKAEMSIKVAQVDSTVLLLGESGVGKEVFAKIIHRASKRKDGPFIKVSCASIPPNLIESELFGYEGGSFTGSKKEGRMGLFEMADGGTIFLDEIGEVPTDVQAKLLRVLQERELFRVGGRKPLSLDVRVVSATNRELEEMVRQGTFRQDLYYRLNVISIRIPPLRQHREDIPPLIHHFLEKFNAKFGFHKKIASPVIGRLVHHNWPGNVRELENTIERMVVLSTDDLIDSDFLWPAAGDKQSDQGWPSLNLNEVLEETERNLIMQVYKECQSTRKAARILGVNQSTVVKKLNKYSRKDAVQHH
jgi:PAS domain S-box-containing protein